MYCEPEAIGDRTIGYVSPMLAAYNSDNADHGNTPTEPGWWVDAEIGPFKTREEALNEIGEY